jgi:hypothetical protein
LKFHCDDPELDERLESSAQPSVVSRSAGHLDVAARGAVPRAMTWTWNGGPDWSHRSHGDHKIMGQPELVAVNPTRVLAVARAGTHDHWYKGPLVWKSFDGTSWTNYVPFGDATEFVGDPAVIAGPPNYAYLVAIGADGHLRASLFDGTGGGSTISAERGARPASSPERRR